jgi:hypothetical protein
MGNGTWRCKRLRHGWGREIVLIAAVVIGAVVMLRLYTKARRWILIIALLAGLIGAATSIYDTVNVQNAISNNQLDDVASVGWGLWVDCIASVSAAIALVVFARTKDHGLSVPTGTPDVVGQPDDFA